METASPNSIQFAFLRLAGLVVLAFLARGAMMEFSFPGPSEDHFDEDLTIPEGIEIAEPELNASKTLDLNAAKGTDELQEIVRTALMVSSGDVVEFAPQMPSLRRVTTDHAKALRDYLEASPNWHVFIEQGNRFAVRRWSYGGEPRDSLHGYVSEFEGDTSFQTRCLICLDRKQWSRYSVQHVEEGSSPVKPNMSWANNLHESRVMVECGGVWVEIFEQSDMRERRVTKATVAALEMEWSTDSAERFGAKAGFMIYEGDRGKPYAARFEVWFRPDSGKDERKLAERIFKIEGWRR